MFDFEARLERWEANYVYGDRYPDEPKEREEEDESDTE